MTKRAVIATTMAALFLAVTPGSVRAQPDPGLVVDAFEGTFGRNPGFRRSFAKGTCAAGEFVGTPEAARLSSAEVFAGARIPATIRFSVGGGAPRASDRSRSVRGMAVRFEGTRDGPWDTAMISAPMFFVATPKNLIRFLQVRRPDPTTGRPNAEAIAAWNAANPDAQPQLRWLAENPLPASWASTGYHSASAFRLQGPGGAARYARWSFEPASGVRGLSDSELAAMPDDFLADELRRRVATAPVVFDMVLQLANPGDNTADATRVWPADRPRVGAGRLTITRVAPGTGGECDAISFLQLTAPGIDAGDDPLTAARPPSYAVSQSRRQP